MIGLFVWWCCVGCYCYFGVTLHCVSLMLLTWLLFVNSVACIVFRLYMLL